MTGKILGFLQVLVWFMTDLRFSFRKLHAIGPVIQKDDIASIGVIIVREKPLQGYHTYSD